MAFDGQFTAPLTSMRPGTTALQRIDGDLGMGGHTAPFYADFPSSADEFRNLGTDNAQSTSKSQYVQVANVTMPSWDEGQDNEIFDGQLVFAVPLDYRAVTGASYRETARFNIPLLTLRHVNTFLRLGYEAAHQLFTQSSGGQRIIEDSFSIDQLNLLSRRPVRDWHRMKFFNDRYRSGGDEEVKQLVYLSEHLILERFNVYGWIYGQVPVDGRLKQISVRRGGSIDDAENIWSSDMFPGDNLYLILKRVYDEGKGQWTHFAFLPWFGPDMPTLQDRAYRDYSGTVEYGCAIYIGSLDRYTHDVTLRRDELPQLIGIKPCTLQRVRYGPEPGCLRITAVNSKNRLPWLF